MINREILYERNLTGSYMKIPVALNAKFDEKIMLKRKLPGLLQVERCYVNGQGQYWYNITGKQSLDTYCKMRSIGLEFIERMIISICNEIEILEWNLIDINSLMLDPELMFVTNQNGEIIFTIYPGEHTMLSNEFQQLMEYLLTKIDHSDMEAVRAAYSIYEKTLDDTYSIVDIRDIIISHKDKNIDSEMIHKHMVDQKFEYKTSYNNENLLEEKEDNEHNQISDLISKISQKNETIARVIDSVKKYIKECKNKKKEKGKRNKYEEDFWITPEVEDLNEEPERMIQSNPTICLNNVQAKPRGVLLYDGMDDLENIPLDATAIRLGKAMEADVIIDKETISRFHAKIEQHERNYYIEDLNSTNGTMINGETLAYKERRKLEINDIVQLADVRYRFV